MPTSVFISYAHRDDPQWLAELKVWFEPLIRDSMIDFWDDSRIRPGAHWRQEIAAAINRSRIVILLVSPFFLASEFVGTEELPQLLESAERNGTVIIPVLVHVCWIGGKNAFLNKYQFLNSPSEPLNRADETGKSALWIKLLNRVNELLNDVPAQVASSPSDGRSRALLIVNDDYLDPGFKVHIPRFSSLWETAKESRDLSGALSDSRIGGFELVTIANGSLKDVLAKIQNLFRGAGPNDRILLYIYGLAIKHETKGLCFGLRETQPGRDDSTVLEAVQIQKAMEGNASKGIVVIVDCVFACALGRAGNARDVPIYKDVIGFQGEGRFVLSSSEVPRLRWRIGEGRLEPTEEAGSEWQALAKTLSDGLWTGKADVDRNLAVTIGELFGYLESDENQKPREIRVRPTRWAFDRSKGELKIASVWSTVFATPATPTPDTIPARSTQTKSELFIPDLRHPVLDMIAPAYVLDHNYTLLDWNPAFDRVVAAQLGLVRRRDSATAFVQALVNSKEVVQRYMKEFPDGKLPPVDTESLVFNTDGYEELTFQKISSQVADENGSVKGYVVCLNVVNSGPKKDLLWADIKDWIEEDVTTAQYALVYDKLLLNFEEYLDLGKKAVERLGPPTQTRRVVDLGAGTGNGSIQMLRCDSTREVWAVEQNETMLRILRSKVEALRDQEHIDVEKRLVVVKDDICRLDALEDSTFDGALMINVLYDVRDSEACLRQVSRVLKPGGILVLTTPYDGTDVNALLECLRSRLEAKKLFPALETAMEAAWNRHRAKDSAIHRDSVKQTVERLEQAGFCVDGSPEIGYVGSVVIIKAVKVGEPKEAGSISLSKPVQKSQPTRVVTVPGPKPETPVVATTEILPQYDVFLCHSSHDRPLVSQMRDALEAQGIHCWASFQDVPPGENYVRLITQAISTCRVLVLVLSANSNASPHAPREVSFAATRTKPIPIVPIRLDEIRPSDELAYYLNNVHWLDAFPPPLGDHLPRLITTLQTVLAKIAGDAARLK